MAYATVGDLIKAFREDTRDTVEDYLWSDAQLVRFANEALVEFAEQTKSIYDDESEAALVKYGAGQQVVDLHPAVIDVVEIYSGDRQLRVVAPGVLRRCELPAGGRLELLVLNRSGGSMRLHPTPADAGELQMVVIRRPLVDLSASSAIADVPTGERRHLLLYMKARAYGVHDVETSDPAKADRFMTEWLQACQSVYENALRRRASASQGVRFRW